MPLSDTAIVIKVVLIVLLIILLVTEFFTFFVGVIQMLIYDDNQALLYDGIFIAVVSMMVIALSFFGLWGAVREYYWKLFAFAGVLATVLLVSLMVHLFLLPSVDDRANGDGVYSPNNGKRQAGIQSVTKDLPTTVASFKIPTELNKGKRSNYLLRKEDARIDQAANLQIDSFSPDMWDIIHQKFRCCGPEGAESWIKSNMRVPYSCCHFMDNTSDSVSEICKKSNNGPYVYSKGCVLFQLAFYSGTENGHNRNRSDITLATLIRILGYLLQLATIVLAICLGKLILQARREEYCYPSRKK